MSAGTVLVMSGDAIHMDYYSVLGPIDPQYQQADGMYVPGLAYVEKFNELMDKADAGDLNDAEMAYLLAKFDPAKIKAIEHERELSVNYLEEWLTRYKFKDWKTTKSRGLKVDAKMRRERAAEVGRKLNDPGLWHSHHRGIPESARCAKN